MATAMAMAMAMATTRAGAILAGSQLARWFAVAMLALNAIDMMFFVPAHGSRARLDLAA